MGRRWPEPGAQGSRSAANCAGGKTGVDAGRPAGGRSRSPRRGADAAPAPPPRSELGASPASALIGFTIIIFPRKRIGLPRKKTNLTFSMFGNRVLLLQSSALLPGNEAGTGASGGGSAGIWGFAAGKLKGPRARPAPRVFPAVFALGITLLREAASPPGLGLGAPPAGRSRSRAWWPQGIPGFGQPGSAAWRWGRPTRRDGPGGAGRIRPPLQVALPLVPADCGLCGSEERGALLPRSGAGRWGGSRVPLRGGLRVSTPASPVIPSLGGPCEQRRSLVDEQRRDRVCVNAPTPGGGFGATFPRVGRGFWAELC